jgi:hypothetical protein
MRPFIRAILRSALLGVAAGVLILPSGTDAAISLDRHVASTPIVLNESTDYMLSDVAVTGVRDAYALTLTGNIRSVSLAQSRFGDVLAGENNRAAALASDGARVDSLFAVDCHFYNAENHLVSLRDGSFGTVTFQRCTFGVSDEFLRRLHQRNPARASLPTTEFYNIDRLELLDNEFSNTTIVIHSSVKQVVIRGHIANLLIQNPDTQLIVLPPSPTPG